MQYDSPKANKQIWIYCLVAIENANYEEKYKNNNKTIILAML